MEGKFQDQRQLEKYLEKWFSPRGNKPDRGFFYEQDKQESMRIEYLSPEGSIISNQDPEGGTYNMVVVKQTDAIKGPRVKVDGPLCGGLYKEDNGSIVPWSGTDLYFKLNCFTCSKEENDWIVLGDQYTEYFKTGEDLFTMVNFFRRPSSRQE